MEIYLASTNKLFTQKLINDLLISVPSFHKKSEKIVQLEEKKSLLTLLNNNKYELIIMDRTLLTNDIKKILREKKEGLVWLIDGKLNNEKITDHFYIWKSNDDKQFKAELLRLGMSNPPNKQHSGYKNDSIQNHKTDETYNEKPKKEENVQKKETSTNKNKKVAPKENEKTTEGVSDENIVADFDEEETAVISIAPPYPMEIDDETVHLRLIEAKKSNLNIYDNPETDKYQERISELEPLVKEYFNLVTQREYVRQADKRLLATMEMYDFVNLNQSLRNKPIGVWSPKQGIGVTTFVMNFAFYLGKRKLPISVMEALTERPVIYKELERVASNKKIFPKDWMSYVEYMNKRKEVEKISVKWLESAVIDFRGVYWYPLRKGINDYRQSVIEDIPYYLSFCNPKEVVLVDLPTGELKRDTRKLIKQLKELWILLDGSTDLIFSYVNYLKQLQADNPHLKISLILLDYFPYVSEKLIRKAFEYPVLTTLPDLNDEVRKNKYQHNSIMDNKDIQSLLEGTFSKIGSYIYEDNFTDNVTVQLNNHSLVKALEKLRRIFV